MCFMSALNREAALLFAAGTLAACLMGAAIIMAVHDLLSADRIIAIKVAGTR